MAEAKHKEMQLAVVDEDSTTIQGQRSMAKDPYDGMSTLQVFLKSPIIIICALYANVGAIMFGYDTVTLALCLNFKAFVNQFGTLSHGKHVIPTMWQSLWNAIPTLTTALGAWISGPLSEKIGRRWALLCSGAFAMVGVGVLYIAETPEEFLGGKMIVNFGLGIGLATGQTYISEIVPVKIRGIALANYNFCFGIGNLIAASVAYSRVNIMDKSSYKVILASEWTWPIILMLGAFLVPESPYLLVRKKKDALARQSLRRLHSNNVDRAEYVLREIQQTVIFESEISASTFRECFTGTDWRRTRIAVYANGLVAMLGSSFLHNAPYFMVLGGMSSTNIASMVELGMGLSIISTFFTFWAMPFIGRRQLILGGITLQIILFIIMGIAASVPNQNHATSWCIAISLQLGWLSLGPASGPAVAMAGEISAIKLRAKTQAIGFFFNFAFQAVWLIVTPYIFNPGWGNLGGKTGWVFLGTSLIGLVVVFLEFPETKDLTVAELDQRFKDRVKTRDFKRSLRVDLLEEEGMKSKNVEHVESATI